MITNSELIELHISVREQPLSPAIDYIFAASDGHIAESTTVPDPEAALNALSQHGEKIFFPKLKLTRCRQVYGGPQVARVRGTYKGQEVDRVFKRTDSCEIAKWRALAPLFGMESSASGEI